MRRKKGLENENAKFNYSMGDGRYKAAPTRTFKGTYSSLY